MNKDKVFFEIIDDKKNIPKEVNVYGMKIPDIIIQEGRKFMAIKESYNSNDEKNMGIIIKPSKLVNKEMEYIVGNNINNRIKQLGGDDFYGKYLKYKQKYLYLKRKMLLRNP